MNRTREEWSKVKPLAVAGGSEAQTVNVMTMMLKDIEALYRAFDEIAKISEANPEKYVAKADDIAMQILCGARVKP
jgi:hypothetical protein